jgi:hypothetical protein
LEFLNQSYDKYAEDDKEKGSLAYLKLAMESVLMHIANIALTLQENEDKFLANKDKVSCILLLRILGFVNVLKVNQTLLLLIIIYLIKKTIKKTQNQTNDLFLMK